LARYDGGLQADGFRVVVAVDAKGVAVVVVADLAVYGQDVSMYGLWRSYPAKGHISPFSSWSAISLTVLWVSWERSARQVL
jgi:hypothetical protein